MKLSYRGIQYDANGIAETLPSESFARYRGVSYRIQRSAAPQTQTRGLKYRGVSYHPKTSDGFASDALVPSFG